MIENIRYHFIFSKIGPFKIIAIRSLFSVSSALLAEEEVEIKEPSEKTVTTKNLVLAFSGGGYHVLSGASSWIMGMHARGHNLEDITGSIQAIGSNSGGSWFMSMATYSPTFAAELVKPDAAVAFTSDEGYMGIVWNQIGQNLDGCAKWAAKTDAQKLEQGICRIFQGIIQKKAGSGFANFLLSGGGQWQQVVESSVYGQAENPADNWPYYHELAGKTLSTDASERNPWMQNLNWVLAGTLLTDSPALTYSSRSKTPELLIQGIYKGVQVNQGTQPGFPKNNPLTDGVPLMLGATLSRAARG